TWPPSPWAPAPAAPAPRTAAATAAPVSIARIIRRTLPARPGPGHARGLASWRGREQVPGPQGDARRDGDAGRRPQAREVGQGRLPAAVADQPVHGLV